MPHASFVEILGKLGKNPTEASFATIDLAIRGLLDSGVYGWVNPSSRAIGLPLSLVRRPQEQ